MQKSLMSNKNQLSDSSELEQKNSQREWSLKKAAERRELRMRLTTAGRRQTGGNKVNTATQDKTQVRFLWLTKWESVTHTIIRHRTERTNSRSRLSRQDTGESAKSSGNADCDDQQVKHDSRLLCGEIGVIKCVW